MEYYNQRAQEIYDLEMKRRTEICQELFGQENIIGLTTDQLDLFWSSI